MQDSHSLGARGRREEGRGKGGEEGGSRMQGGKVGRREEGIMEEGRSEGRKSEEGRMEEVRREEWEGKREGRRREGRNLEHGAFLLCDVLLLARHVNGGGVGALPVVLLALPALHVHTGLDTQAQRVLAAVPELLPGVAAAVFDGV